MCGVEVGGEFYDEDFFRTVAVSGARALLIGRRALIALGAPVMTSDYDVWLHFDDVEKLNAAFAALDHYPNHPPEEARKRGRYVLENGQRVDVLIARAATAPTLERLTFQEAWMRVRRCKSAKASSPSFRASICSCLGDRAPRRRCDGVVLWAGAVGSRSRLGLRRLPGTADPHAPKALASANESKRRWNRSCRESCVRSLSERSARSCRRRRVCMRRW